MQIIEIIACPDCKGTGIDHVKSNPFVKKECETCMGTGSAHAPEYIYVCEICEKSYARELTEEKEKTEMGCHSCMIIVCMECQEEKDGGIYFVFRSKSGRFVECMVEYDEEDDEVLLRGNDHVYGRI